MPVMQVSSLCQNCTRAGLDPRGPLTQPWPASNLADGFFRQDLGPALLDHVADRRALEALVLEQVAEDGSEDQEGARRKCRWGSIVGDFLVLMTNRAAVVHKILMLRCSDWVRFANPSNASVQPLIVFPFFKLRPTIQH
jgi:hypothetical protein